jgi:hypothetical protein
LSVKENLLKDHYRYTALTPVNPLVIPVIPEMPINAVVEKEGKNITLSWEKQANNSLYVIYRFKFLQRKKIEKPDKIIFTTSYQKILLTAAKGYRPSRFRYVVTALSPTHAESEPVKFKKK